MPSGASKINFSEWSEIRRAERENWRISEWREEVCRSERESWMVFHARPIMPFAAHADSISYTVAVTVCARTVTSHVEDVTTKTHTFDPVATAQEKVATPFFERVLAPSNPYGLLKDLPSLA